MMDENTLTRIAEEIMTQGIDRSTAFDYAALIGDTPIISDGKLLVLDEFGKEVARINPLKFFDSK